MENILATIDLALAFIALILLAIAIQNTNSLIRKFKQENADLRSKNTEITLQLGNAERRATCYARKLKKLEDVIVKKEQNNEFDTIALTKIKKELFPETNQDK